LYWFNSVWGNSCILIKVLNITMLFVIYFILSITKANFVCFIIGDWLMLYVNFKTNMQYKKVTLSNTMWIPCLLIYFCLKRYLPISNLYLKVTCNSRFYFFLLVATLLIFSNKTWFSARHLYWRQYVKRF